jgi:hypothetical protein
MSTTHVGLSITKAAVHALDEVLPNGKDREYLEGLNACFQSFTDLRASLPSNNFFCPFSTSNTMRTLSRIVLYRTLVNNYKLVYRSMHIGCHHSGADRFFDARYSE